MTSSSHRRRLRSTRSTRSTRSALPALLAIAALLAACGGGGDAVEPSQEATGSTRERALAVTVNPSGWVAVPAPNDALMQNLSIPSDAPTRGMWSATGNWPMNGLHQAVLPNGKVLTWGTPPNGGSHNGRTFDVWDPSRGLASSASHSTTTDSRRQDSFCAAATYIGDGGLMITGGNGTSRNAVTSQIYSSTNNTITLGSANVADQRWYSTMITLPDGRPIILGGIAPYEEGQYRNPDQAVAQGLSSMTPEVFENGRWRSLFGATSRDAFGPDFLRASIPKAWVVPSGRVFGIGTERMWFVDPLANGGNGATTIAGAFKTAPNSSTRPNTGPTSTAVMYAPGRVLVVGGNAYGNGSGMPASALATAIDVTGSTPVLSEQPAMSFGRQYPNAVVLPDGQVVVTGGESQTRNDPRYAVYEAELWNPATGRWTVMARAGIFRGYHSQTGLLPNGTVLSTGGGTPGPAQLWGEVFYPPYLFRTVSGTARLAPRPSIVGISGLRYANGAAMQLDMASDAPVSQLVLMGLSVGTHSFNAGQRRVPLSFSQDSIRLTTTLPNGNLAPPGYYQVVALDAAGVPSYGVIVAVGQGVSTPPTPVEPYTPPGTTAVIDAPVITAGGTASYRLTAQAGVTYRWNFGDGTPATAFSSNPNVTHVFADPGVYGVTLTARGANGAESTRSFLQAVGSPPTALAPTSSSAMALETRANASARLWVVNPDNDSVAVIDTATGTRVAEIAVGRQPVSVAVSPAGAVWVVNKGAASISVVNAASLSVERSIALARASRPHGLAFAPDGSGAFVALEALGSLVKLDATSGSTLGNLAVGAHARHVAVTADSATVLVSRFVTPSLAGESTATVATSSGGGVVAAVAARTLTLNRDVVLRHSDKVDTETQGAGVPNYLGAAVISPDGRSAWVPSKQDNIARGLLRSGQNLDFQNSVRAISSRIDLGSLAEDHARRVDHDNSSLGSAAAFHPSGAYLFVALETSRQVAVVDAQAGVELFKVDVGRAPQAVAVSADGRSLYVQNFMDRSVSMLDLSALVLRGEPAVSQRSLVATRATERLSAQVLSGKQLFYDARDPRLSRDSYMSCASCHNDGGHDGRVWDFTGFGEGLRNTIALNGRAATGHGFLHWSANFDELQDFEGQIRNFAGGTGLMTDAQFNSGTRSSPLGDRKAGVSADLDALAAYVASLRNFDASPYRNADGSLSAAGTAGKAVFAAAGCAGCHDGTAFSRSGAAGALRSVGTIRSTSGQRLGATLSGLDIPTLRDLWNTAPYLHDGGAATIAAAVQAHAGTTVAGVDLANLETYLREIGSEEPAPGAAPPPVDPPPVDPPPALPPADAVTCAAERQTCVMPAGATATVWYGAEGSWVVRTGLSGSVACNNTTFGDPLPGVVKSCRYRTGSAAPANRPPTVALTSPSGGSSVAQGSTVALAATAADADGSVARVEFYDGATLLGTDTSAPYGYSWSGAAVGAHTLTARAFDNAGASTTSAAVTISVTAVVANQPPTVALTSPSGATSVVQGTAISLAAAAADVDGSIARVEFYNGGTRLGSDTSAPYSYSWSGAAVGSYTVTARAFDNAGASTTSAAVSVTVTAPPTPPGQPPSNAITCAQENKTCALPSGATATVWFGANTKWVVKTGLKGNVACNRATFGDPIYGTVKACRYVVTSGG